MAKHIGIFNARGRLIATHSRQGMAWTLAAVDRANGGLPLLAFPLRTYKEWLTAKGYYAAPVTVQRAAVERQEG